MNLIVSIPSKTGSVHTQNKGSLTVPTKQRQYPYQPEYHRATKTVPYTTNGDNKHSTKVHKNSCM